LPDLSDVTAFTLLDRAIQHILRGDDKTPGLYHTLRSCPTWDAYQRACAKIEAYETVLDEMHRIARVMSGEPERAQNAPRYQ
jgi:hypothetical protein